MKNQLALSIWIITNVAKRSTDVINTRQTRIQSRFLASIHHSHSRPTVRSINEYGVFTSFSGNMKQYKRLLLSKIMQ